MYTIIYHHTSFPCLKIRCIVQNTRDILIVLTHTILPFVTEVFIRSYNVPVLELANGFFFFMREKVHFKYDSNHKFTRK